MTHTNVLYFIIVSFRCHCRVRAFIDTFISDDCQYLFTRRNWIWSVKTLKK